MTDGARLRILLISTPVGPVGSGVGGGVETTLRSLVAGLAREHCVRAMAPAASRLPGMPDRLIEIAGEWQPSVLAAEAPQDATILVPDGVLQAMMERAWRLQDDYDVVCNLAYDWLPLWMTPFFHTPVVHLISMSAENQMVAAQVEHLSRTRPAAIAFHSRVSADTYRLAAPATVLGNGFEPRGFGFEANPEPTLGWVGRISAEKGLEDAVAAAARAGMPLQVWGRIDDQAYWQAVCRRAAPGTIRYHGFLPVDVLWPQLACCTALLVTPKWIEAFGNVAAEAALCGVPVIAYRRGGLCEIVEHGVTGILTEPDDVDALVRGIEQAKQLDRGVVAETARARFSIDAFIARTVAWLRTSLPPG